MLLDSFLGLAVYPGQKIVREDGLGKIGKHWAGLQEKLVDHICSFYLPGE